MLPPSETLPLAAQTATSSIGDVLSRVGVPIAAILGTFATGFTLFKGLKFVQTVPEGFVGARIKNKQLYDAEGVPYGIVGPGLRLHAPIWGGIAVMQSIDQVSKRPITVQHNEQWMGELTVVWGVECELRDKNRKLRKISKESSEARHVCDALRASAAGPAALESFVVDLTCVRSVGDFVKELPEEALKNPKLNDMVAEEVMKRINPDLLQEKGIAVRDLVLGSFALTGPEMGLEGSRIIANAINKVGTMNNTPAPQNGYMPDKTIALHATQLNQ